MMLLIPHHDLVTSWKDYESSLYLQCCSDTPRVCPSVRTSDCRVSTSLENGDDREVVLCDGVDE